MSKLIKFSKEALESLLRGVDILAEAVSSTLGAKGQTVIIEKPFLLPHITKDGVTVAKEIELSDPFENMGAELIKQSAISTVNTVGDGTTTAVVLTHDLLHKAIDHDVNKKVIEQIVEDVVKFIKDHSEKININSLTELKQIATISANNDPEIGEMIANAIYDVGENGVVLVEESRDFKTIVEQNNGIVFNKGYLSEYFVTNINKMTVEYDNPLFLFIDGTIRDIQRLVPTIEFANKVGRPLIIVADEIIEGALNMIVTNKMKNGFRIAAIKAPSFGANKEEMMKDMAIATGGLYIHSSESLSLDMLNTNEMITKCIGEADKVIIKKNRTTIVGGRGDEDEMNIRIQTIIEQFDESSPERTKQLKERIANLKGSIAIIKVGATTELEMKEKKDRVDDAVAATQAALEEGIVPGGGIMLLRAYFALRCPANEYFIDFLRAPFVKILSNADYKLTEGDMTMLANTSFNTGYDALLGEWCDLRKRGIIDPAKVVRVALENAASTALTILSTSTVIVLEQQPQNIPQW